MSSSSLPPSPIPENASPELKSEIESIIEELRHASPLATEGLVMLLLTKILARLSKKHGKALSLATLTKKQQEEVEAELDRIALALQKSGALGSDDTLLGYLKKMLRRAFGDKEEQLDDPEHMEEKSKKEYHRLLKLFVVYEIYKISNPNQLAGETELDNFINNTVTRGIDFAIKFSSKDEAALEQIGALPHHTPSPETAQKISNSFVENLTKARGEPGWER